MDQVEVVSQLEALSPFSLWSAWLLLGIPFYQRGNAQGIGLGRESSCECWETCLRWSRSFETENYTLSEAGLTQLKILLKDMTLIQTRETIASMSVARQGVASVVLNEKIYAIGGNGLSSLKFTTHLQNLGL